MVSKLGTSIPEAAVESVISSELQNMVGLQFLAHL